MLADVASGLQTIHVAIARAGIHQAGATLVLIIVQHAGLSGAKRLFLKKNQSQKRIKRLLTNLKKQKKHQWKSL